MARSTRELAALNSRADKKLKKNMTDLSIQTELILSPEGHLYLDEGSQASEELSSAIFDKIKVFFTKSSALGLLHLGIQDLDRALSPSFLFWRSFAIQFVKGVCRFTHLEDQTFPSLGSLTSEQMQQFIDEAPCMKGIEYLTVEVLHELWKGLANALRNELTHFSGSIQDYLKHYNPHWNLVGKVCFHLAENKKDEERPFAFLATYTTHLSEKKQAQHLPLKKAIQDLAGEKNNAALLSLLLPVKKTAEKSPFIQELIDTGSIFQVETWSAKQAYQFLKDIPHMEAAGVMVKVPNWWSPEKPPRAQIVVKLGDKQTSTLGLSALVDFEIRLAIDDEEQLTQEEWNELLYAKDRLVRIRGKWVEIDQEKLQSIYSQLERFAKGKRNALSMAEALRFLAGSSSKTSLDEEIFSSETFQWSTVVAGDWLKSVLEQLRNPNLSQDDSFDKVLHQYLLASLRPYQMAGVKWLWLLYKLQIGGCLADDMGLGKTIQVISLFLLTKYHPLRSCEKPHLLIVPASLIGNWMSELERFAPSLKLMIAHSSVNSQEKLAEITSEKLQGIDIVLTTYGNAHRLSWLAQLSWDLIVLDEAQLIKNPGTKQTRAIKTLEGKVRFTLTGTPVENRLGDLWSLFDFTSKGLLGSSKVFASYAKSAGTDQSSSKYMRFLSSLRSLTKPYILRRLKSDKSIISDLPDKTELKSYCSLSKEQIRLYQEAVNELSEKLYEPEGIERNGIVLSYLLRLKQICNHPTQWLGYGEYLKEASGKLLRLEEICEEIAAKQEKVLVFTQFKEIIPALFDHLTKIFGREGLFLHGSTAVKTRKALVEEFQQERGPPFFVLSLKAGGTGLTLTRASHVIHFDRWWNPAVENQATDRAYRIGQKHPVLVHKFICRGTVEEKIDHLIDSKSGLSQGILEGGEELVLTSLSNQELMDLISLDIQKACGGF